MIALLLSSLVLASFSVGDSDANVFFKKPWWAFQGTVPVRFTPLGVDTNAFIRLDYRTASGMFATVDGWMERLVVPNIYDNDPDPAMHWMELSPPDIQDLYSIDFDGRWWNLMLSARAGGPVPCPHPSDRDYTGLYGKRIFSDIPGKMESVAKALRKQIIGLELYPSQQLGNSLPGSSAFEGSDGVGFALSSREDGEAAFLVHARRDLNLSFADLPEYQGAYGYPQMKGMGYARNAASAIIRKVEDFPTRTIEPLTNYLNRINGESCIVDDWISNTNKDLSIRRISANRIGQINSTLALIDKTYVNGSPPLPLIRYAYRSSDGTYKESKRISGTVNRERSGDRYWRVSIDSAEVSSQTNVHHSAFTNSTLSAGVEVLGDPTYDVVLIASRFVTIDEDSLAYYASSFPTGRIEFACIGYRDEYDLHFVYGLSQGRHEVEWYPAVPEYDSFELSGNAAINATLQTYATDSVAEFGVNGSRPSIVPHEKFKNCLDKAVLQCFADIYGSAFWDYERRHKYAADFRTAKDKKAISSYAVELASTFINSVIDMCEEVAGCSPKESEFEHALVTSFVTNINTVVELAVDSLEKQPLSVTFEPNNYYLIKDETGITLYSGDKVCPMIETETVRTYVIGSIGPTWGSSGSAGSRYKRASSGGDIRFSAALKWKFRNLPLMESE